MKRWTHLIAPGGAALDIACGSGRHMQWLAQCGHRVTGVDRSPDALACAAAFGQTIQADIENGPWPLMNGTKVRQFDAVLVTNYLWRPLFPVIAQSLSPGAVLIYETFAQGNQSVGKPSNPDFLLQVGELWHVFTGLRIVAFEEGFLEHPDRFVQRLTAVQTPTGPDPSGNPRRCKL